MISAVLRRTLVDLWDNAIVVFALNLALLCVGAIVLFAVSRAVHWPPLLFVVLLLAAMMAGLVLLAASAALVEQIAARSDIKPAALIPDLRFCALLTLALAGIVGLAALLISAAPGSPVLAVAAATGGLWLSVVAIQMVVMAPALALDTSQAALAKLGWMAMLVLRYPIATFFFAAMAVLSLAATVCLLPGPAGAGYLFLRAGRMMRVHLQALYKPTLNGTGGEQAAIAAEMRPLKNRTPRNLLQPWRVS